MKDTTDSQLAKINQVDQRLTEVGECNRWIFATIEQAMRRLEETFGEDDDDSISPVSGC